MRADSGEERSTSQLNVRVKSLSQIEAQRLLDNVSS